MDGPAGRSKGVNGFLAAMPFGARDDARVGFEALYRSSRDDVFGYVATLLRDRSAAEDITATAFERAYRKRASFSAKRGSPRAWLFAIARNAALDELRRRGRQASVAGEAVQDLEPEPLEDLAELSARREAVRAALLQLEPRERDLIALKFHGGLTNAEVARVLGTTETNAGTLLHRTVTKLRKACYETA
jgi:RNA polymerase sigma-70 factor (ECF subfamily)